MTHPRKAMIDKMRADFVVVAEARRTSGDWSEADEKAFGQAIKAAIDADNADTMCMWALWLSDLAHVLTTCAMAVRNAEGRMRAAARVAAEERDKTSEGKRTRRPPQ